MTQAKRKSPSMVRLTIVLFLITAITALLLSLVNHITKDKIAEADAEKTKQAMELVMPSGAQDATPLERTFEKDIIKGAYKADGMGFIILVSPSGFGGEIQMAVGIDNDAKVTGVSIIKMSETSGLGSNASDPSWLSQFTGEGGPFKLDKDKGRIDALTGATVTSRAVTEGVNAALDAANSLE